MGELIICYVHLCSVDKIKKNTAEDLFKLLFCQLDGVNSLICFVSFKFPQLNKVF